jgi:hypothetical protein
LDQLLAETFFTLVMVILMHRYRLRGLLLSELRSHLLDTEQAPAGTKRVSNLLRSPKWSRQMIEQYLWQHANKRMEELKTKGKLALAI